MSKTAIQASLPPISPQREPLPAQAATRASLWDWVRWVLKPIASLRLTVALFALSILLVFFGTLAQIDEGIWTVLQRYFRTEIAWIPWQVFVRFGQVFLGVSKTAEITGRFPFPGGWLLGGLLTLNLLAAHLVRFQLSWRRAGVVILHFGLLIMLVSEFITGKFADEARMTIVEGETVNFTEDPRSAELAIVDSSAPKSDDVIAIPGKLLQHRKGETIDVPDRPFYVEVNYYYVNSSFPEAAISGDKENHANAGMGEKKITTRLPEVSGLEGAIDFPSAYVTFKEKGTGKPLGTYLVSTWWSAGNGAAQKLTVGGKTYDIGLRWKREYKPYSVTLREFKHEKYMGTNIPKNFSSDVVLTKDGEPDREQLIYMNHPLRYNAESHWLLFKGETFYQADFLQDGRKGTVLQVVRNPGWLMPYVSCFLVAVGMLLHFGQNLYRFLARRIAQ